MVYGSLIEGLFGDDEVFHKLDVSAEIAAMVQFEAALARVEGRFGVIPVASATAISDALKDLKIDPTDLVAETTSVGVPIPGLVKALRAHVGHPHGGYVHWGATSQDVVDSGFVLRAMAILEILETRLTKLVRQLAALADKHSDLPMAGRTRSQLATPTTLGLRIAGWMCPLNRCLDRLAELRPRLLVVQFGGATGNLSVLGDKAVEVMEALAGELGLGCGPKSWHVERDGIVELANWLSMVSGLLGRIGADLILMGRSESREVVAGAGGGSSTMPQKQNPVLAETLVTLARTNASQVGLAQQALMHTEERDGAAWSTEWLCMPPMLIATAAGLRNCSALMSNFHAFPERMQITLESEGGTVQAEALAFAMADYMPLAEAQAIVKDAAHATSLSGGNLGQKVTAICVGRGIPVPKPDSDQVTGVCGEFVARAVRSVGWPFN